LSEQQRGQRRDAYAHAAAADVRSRAEALLDAWDADGGDFRTAFVEAGDDTRVFPLDHAALNALSNALFYVEIEVKDQKLGLPLGLGPDCVNAPAACPDSVESRYARVSTDHLRQNLIGLRRAFEGCGAQYSGLGFDDWLDAIGAEDLRARMLDALVGAQEAIESLDPPLEQALLSDPAQVEGVHAAVKRFTDLLKTEFVSVLNLELPRAAATDND
jgi:predicted lipoprotein